MHQLEADAPRPRQAGRRRRGRNYSFANSTRRFIARPSGFALLATACVSPLPSVVKRSAAIANCSASTFATDAARRFDRSRLLAAVPTLSVCP